MSDIENSEIININNNKNDITTQNLNSNKEIECVDKTNKNLSNNTDFIINEETLLQNKYKCNGYSNNTKSKKRLILSLVCCVVFFLIELIFGLISGSLALVSDSFHMLTDATGFIISLVAILFSNRHATKSHTYGFHRAEILGVLISIFLIWIVTTFLFVEAVERLRNPVEINGKIMLITSIFGIVMNIVLFFTLGHDHGDHGDGNNQDNHNHKHENNSEEIELDEVKTEKEKKTLAKNIKNYDKNMNINVKSAFIHVLGDFLSSIGVLIAAIIIYIDKDLVFFDPICTFIFSVIIIVTTLRLLWQAVSVLMESTPSNIDLISVSNDLKNIQGVEEVHDLHIWNLTVGKPSMTVHITINSANLIDDTNAICMFERVLYESQMLICSKYKIHHSTIQIELSKKNKCCDKHDIEFNKFTEHCEPGLCSLSSSSTSSLTKKKLHHRNKKNKK